MSGAMPLAGEEEYALRVCEAGAVPAYEAVHRVGATGRRSGSKLLAVGSGIILALALVSSFLLSAERPLGRVTGAPSARDISEATLSLSIGKSPAAKLGAPAPTQLNGVPGDYGSLRKVPEEGYNIFDPHYSHDGVPHTISGGTSNGVFTGHSGPSVRGGPLTFGPNTYWNVFNPDGSPDRGPCNPVRHVHTKYAYVTTHIHAQTCMQACQLLEFMTALFQSPPPPATPSLEMHSINTHL